MRRACKRQCENAIKLGTPDGAETITNIMTIQNAIGNPKKWKMRSWKKLGSACFWDCLKRGCDIGGTTDGSPNRRRQYVSIYTYILGAHWKKYLKLVLIPLGFGSPTSMSQFVSPTNRQLAIQIATLAFSAVGLLRRKLLSISATVLARCWRDLHGVSNPCLIPNIGAPRNSARSSLDQV